MSTVDPIVAQRRSAARASLRGCLQDCAAASWCWRRPSRWSSSSSTASSCGRCYLSFTNSKAFTNLNFIGWSNYRKLWNWTFEIDPPSNWYTALVNMGMFGGLYVVFCLALGLTLAILLDQKIRGEGVLRPIYLYPLALSFIVTGTAWKLFLDPRHRA